MKFKEDPHMVDQLKPRPKDENGLLEKRYIKTQYGTGLVTKNLEQHQMFIELTTPMSLGDAVVWVLNTGKQKPLILAYRYKTSTVYSIVNPTNEKIELLGKNDRIYYKYPRHSHYPNEILYKVRLQK